MLSLTLLGSTGKKACSTPGEYMIGFRIGVPGP